MSERIELSIPVPAALVVSGLLAMPRDALCLYALAHGAGAGMRHSFMEAVAEGLANRQVATLRYQFPYMERGSRRPDPPKVAHATVRAAVEAASKVSPGLPLIAGGKSYGGRMTSQAQAEGPLSGVVGLAFLGWPLHPTGKPSIERAEHLAAISIPMLFIQGTRDALGDRELLETVLNRLGSYATLIRVPDGDHSLHVRARSGRTDKQVLSEALDAFVEWAKAVLPPPL